VIEQAVDRQFLGEGAPVFGVAGSTKGDGRKGEALVAQMVRHGYKVRAWGSGWPCEIVANQIQHLPAFYRGLDYYVVTSSDEGGCTPIIEAMAMKIPVISPRIGFAISRPVIAYNAGDWESLHRILRDLTEHRTYEDWAADHARYFLRMMA
jgi:glycosyltransferase involved in cell wall biosynthesis